MDLPTDMFIKPVPDHDDLIAFNFDFGLKALEDDGTVIEELEDGDLLIEGWAAEFDGVDRQGENFVDGAFQRGIKSFLNGNAALCFHHQYKKVLGKVLDLEEVEGKGLKMRARVDGAIKDHPELGTIYHQIKRGTLKGLSVGGFFKRKLTPEGRRICDMDFTEISVTGVPVHSKPAFSVVAGKALEDFEENLEDEKDEVGFVVTALDDLAASFKALEGKAVKGDPQDLYFLALLLKLEQMSNSLASSDEVEEGGPQDSAVDALIKEFKDTTDELARKAHKLAAKLGPLPTVTYM